MKTFIATVSALLVAASSCLADEFGGGYVDNPDKLKAAVLIGTIQPGESLVVEVEFRSDLEQDLSIYSFPEGNRIKFFNDRTGPEAAKTGRWVSGPNLTQKPISFALTPHFADGHWTVSWTKQIYAHGNKVVVGCEDYRDRTYNDAIITMTIEKPAAAK